MSRTLLGLALATAFALTTSNARAQSQSYYCNTSETWFGIASNDCQGALNFIASKGNAGNKTYNDIVTAKYYIDNAHYYMMQAKYFADINQTTQAANTASVAMQYWNFGANVLYQAYNEAGSQVVKTDLDTALGDGQTAAHYAWLAGGRD